MNDCVIKIEHLRKEYPGVTPLADINAEIHRGEVIALIGPSGTGKSTLLRCINRLETPTAGTITVLGTEVTAGAAELSRVRQRVGMVFQSFCLFDHLTCLENIIAAPMDLKKMPRAEAEAKARQLLKQVGMAGREDAFPSELSGGQKQRAAIARALAMDPEILLLDEPTSALDPKMVAEVEQVIKNLAGSDITMLIVTHEMRFARSVSSRVFFLCDGCIYEEGSPEQIFEHPQREKTIDFIRGSRALKLDLNPAELRLEDSMRELQDFLRKSEVPTRDILKTQGLFEELVTVRLLKPHPELSRLQLELSAEKEIRLCLTYPGEEIDPLQGSEEDISLRLIRGIARCSHTYTEGINRITAILN